MPSARWRAKILHNETQRVEKYLKLLLQAFGAVTAVALVPFVMPRSWMAAVHDWLGMGVLPDNPVVEYLAVYLLFRPDVTRYFRGMNAELPQIPKTDDVSAGSNDS